MHTDPRYDMYQVHVSHRKQQGPSKVHEEYEGDRDQKTTMHRDLSKRIK